MANARALDKRRKSIKNIRKITRTMELIATARFKKAMERAVSATDYTNRMSKVVGDLAAAGLEVSHPLLEDRPTTENAVLLVLSGNRGMCGGYNGNVTRAGIKKFEEMTALYSTKVDVSGKRGISGFGFKEIEIANAYTHFEDQPKYEEVEPIAQELIDKFLAGSIDRVEIAYTQFISTSKQRVVVETLLPMSDLSLEGENSKKDDKGNTESIYEFVPSAQSILEEVVPASFKVKLYKCFLDAAVSEQIARMVAMKSATENASDMIKTLSRTYNRARQSQITGEIMEVIGGVEALNS